MWKLFSSLCLLSNICCSFCVNRNANISCWNFLSLSLSLSIHLSYIQVKIRVLRIEIRMKIFVVVIVRGALETFQWILKRFLMMRRTFKQFASFWMLNFMLYVIWRTTQNKTQSPYISLHCLCRSVVCMPIAHFCATFSISEKSGGDFRCVFSISQNNDHSNKDFNSNWFISVSKIWNERREGSGDSCAHS